MYLSAMCEASHPVTTIDGAHGLSTSVAARPAGATDLDENETQGPSTSLGMTELRARYYRVGTCQLSS